MESMNIQERYAAARDKFFTENPRALTEIESISRTVIEAGGSSVEEYREHQRSVVFAEAAKRRGIEVDEYVIQLVSESPAQAREWRLERQREIAESIGMEWDEYKQLNRITD